jgi:hypothetical protein
MPRVYMFNPLTTPRPVPTPQEIIVNGDSAAPYKIPLTYAARKYLPLSSDGERIPGTSPNGNAFCDSNTLVVKNPGLGPVNYQFDLAPDQADMIAYMFADRILLLKQDGEYAATYWPAPPPEPQAATFAGRRARESSAVLAIGRGSVFVFNVNPVTITFSANGGPISEQPLQGWASTAANKPYTPTVQKVGRVANQSDGLGQFWGPSENQPGVNQIIVTPQTSSPGTFGLTISSSINKDLFLYVLQDRWLLFDGSAELLDSGSISPIARQPAA